MTRDRVAALFVWVVVLYATDDARVNAGDVDVGRLAALASRDSKMFVWVGDRAACLRRARATDVAQVVEQIGSDELRDGAFEALSRMSLFLSPTMLAAAPPMLSAGSGAVAISVEGFVADGGVPRPDVLLVADLDGFEGVVAAILDGRRQRAMQMCDRVGLELRIADDPPPTPKKARGAAACQFTTRAGQQLLVAEADGLLLVARSLERINGALDRLRGRSYGSLLDSPRFRQTVERVAPRPGHLFAYVNLRRIRQEEVYHLAEEGPLRDLLIERLGGYDGLGFAVRGLGSTFQARVFLEQGPGSRDASLLRPNAPFHYASTVVSPLSGVVSMRMTGEQAADLLLSMSGVAGGGRRTADTLQDAFRAYGGARRFAPLASLLDGEMTLVQPRGIVTGELVPRFMVAMETHDPRGVSAWFDGIARESGGRLVAPVEVEGKTIYELRVPGIEHLSRMAFAVRDRTLIGASNALVLREAWRDESSGVPLARDDAFYAPFDRIDVDPMGDGSGQGYFDTRRLARGLVAWLPGVFATTPLRGDRPMVGLFQELMLVCDDPEFQDALSGCAFHARRVDGGVVIDASGP